MDTLNVQKLVKTKIVCTLGPASTSESMIEKMINAGMDVVRLNFSHGDHEDFRRTFNLVRKLSEKYNHQVSIICDIQGPKIRTGIMAEPFMVKVGDQIRITPHEVTGTPECIQIRYATMLEDLHPGDFVFINDGIIRLIVNKKEEACLLCTVEAGGMISDKKGCNIPSGNISLNVITPKDERDLKLIAELDPEWVAASFIGYAKDVQKVKDMLASFGNTNIKVISKIERPCALEVLDEIIEVTDAVMVARGDLGVEIDTWDVPTAQKMMCRKCNQAGKPVIVATQMLESMISCPRPTRAEASDVYNAVLDGADAVMLSGESAVGKYPVEAITIMDRIVDKAEKNLHRQSSAESMKSAHFGMTESVGFSTYLMSNNFQELGWTGKILIMADPPSAYVARMVSKFRPNLDVIGIASDKRTAYELNILFGVRSVWAPHLAETSNVEELFLKAIQHCLKIKLLSEKDHVICVTRSLFGKHTGTVSAIYDIPKLTFH
jgi:pyruvate kinase